MLFESVTVFVLAPFFDWWLFDESESTSIHNFFQTMSKKFTEEWQADYAESLASKENKGRKGLGYGSLSNTFHKAKNATVIGGVDDAVLSESVVITKVISHIDLQNRRVDGTRMSICPFTNI